MRRQLVLAFLAASTLGLGEALFRLHGVPNLLPRAAMLCLVWASLSYALPALGVALVLGVVAWGRGASDGSDPALGVQVGLWVWLTLFVEGLLSGYTWTPGIWRTLPLSATIAFVVVWALRRWWPRWLSLDESWLLLHGIALLAGVLWIVLVLSYGAPVLAATLAGFGLIAAAAGLLRPVRLVRAGAAANVLLALAVVTAGLGAELYPHPPVAAGKRPNVLLVTVDTLRADSVGAYGSKRAHTQAMDALAAHGILFEDVTAPDILTAPSHASILTGLDPLTHGVIANAGHPMRSGIRTVAHILRRHGYATAAFISGWTLRQQVIGADLGFDVYNQDLGPYRSLPENARRINAVKLVTVFLDHLGPPLERSERPARETTDDVLAWLASRPPEPFFLWVHYFDPHIPLTPPPKYLRMFAPDGASWPDGNWYAYSSDERVKIAQDPAAVKSMVARYDAEVAYASAEIGRLFAAIAREKRRGLLTILTADHGESHGDRGLFFGRDLHWPSLRVPLILRLPDGASAGTRVRTPVRLIDVAPTILDELGIAPPAPMQGASILPLARGERDESPRSTYSIAWDDARHGGIYPPSYALREGPLELIEDAAYLDHGLLRGAHEEVYDLAHDPLQLQNLAGKHRPAVEKLRQELDAWRSRLSPGAHRRLDAEQERMLRKLGYIR